MTPRERRILRLYNLAPADELAILELQQGLCAICRRPPGKTALATDHRHADGLVRGKLCWQDNRLLGVARDNPDRLRAAAAYLEDPPATRALGGERFGRPGRVTSKSKRRRPRRRSVGSRPRRLASS